MSTTPRRIGGQQMTAAQRVAHAMQQVNAPTACKKCGSIYFLEINAQMYTSGTYGFRSISVQPMKVYLCPCGEVQTPPGMNNGNVAGGERDLFAQSLAAALAHRSNTGLDAASEGFVGIHELNEVKTQLAELQIAFNKLANGETVDELPVAEPGIESDSQGTFEAEGVTDYEPEPEQEEEPQTRTVFAGARVTPPAPKKTAAKRSNLSSQPPIATGVRGRSVAGGTVAEGEVKVLDVRPPQTSVPGGARARMKRQGR